MMIGSIVFVGLCLELIGIECFIVFFTVFLV